MHTPRIIISKNCGNSPKNIFVEKMTAALIEGDTPYLLQSVSDDILWEKLGNKLIHGKSNFTIELADIMLNEVDELTIRHAITHGKAGAVDGWILLRNGMRYAFCDVYEFTNSKGDCVNQITSFRIEITG